MALQGGRALTCCLWARISWQSRADCLLSKWNSSSEIPTALPWASVLVRKPRKFLSVTGFVSCVTLVELCQTFVVFFPSLPPGFFSAPEAAAPVSQHHRSYCHPLGMRLMCYFMHTTFLWSRGRLCWTSIWVFAGALVLGNNVERT